MANQGGARIADEDRFEELPDANDDEVVESDEDEEEAISDSEQYGRQTPPGERIRQRRQKRRSRRRRQQREAGFEDGGGLDVWHDDDDDESDFDEEDIIETHYPPEGYDSASPSSSTDSHLAGIPPELRARTADLLAEAQAANTLSPRAELAFDTAIWTIPLVSVYVLLDVLVRQQYGQPVFWGGVVRRVVSRGPFLGLLSFYSLKHRQSPWTRYAFFGLSLGAGGGFLYVTAKSTFDAVIRQTPALGALWVLSIVKLDLGPALLSLGVVGLFVWGAGLELFNNG
ncbi:hypothetical protein V8E36_004874 [Tilletia maclaganii]